MTTTTGLSKADVRFLLKEALEADRAIRAGNRDRYLIGRRSAFVGTVCRLLKVDKGEMNEYMEFLHDEVVTKGLRMTAIEEPSSWIRKRIR